MKVSKVYTTIDAHVAGEPLRIITGGVPEVKGETQLERRAYCMEHLDHLREVLMYEPRGITGCTVVSLPRLQVLMLILAYYLCTMKAGARCVVMALSLLLQSELKQVCLK